MNYDQCTTETVSVIFFIGFTVAWAICHFLWIIKSDLKNERLEAAEKCVRALMFSETFGHINDENAKRLATASINEWEALVCGKTYKKGG
jgi:uncharacterized membrane protein YciS (DUF1049 family)